MQNPVTRFREKREMLDTLGHAGQSNVELLVEMGMAQTMLWLANRAYKNGDRDTLTRLRMMADAGTKSQVAVRSRHERAERRKRTMADVAEGRL